MWGNDHITTQDYVRELFPGKPPNFYEPLIVLAAIGAVTTTLKLGTAVTGAADARSGLSRQAGDHASTSMSDGRFILAVGIGAYREEFSGLGRLAPREGAPRRHDGRGPRRAAKLFTETRASHEGKYYAFRDVEMLPKSRAQPFPL